MVKTKNIFYTTFTIYFVIHAYLIYFKLFQNTKLLFDNKLLVKYQNEFSDLLNNFIKNVNSLETINDSETFKDLLRNIFLEVEKISELSQTQYNNLKDILNILHYTRTEILMNLENCIVDDEEENSYHVDQILLFLRLISNIMSYSSTKIELSRIIEQLRQDQTKYIEVEVETVVDVKVIPLLLLKYYRNNCVEEKEFLKNFLQNKVKEYKISVTDIMKKKKNLIDMLEEVAVELDERFNKMNFF